MEEKINIHDIITKLYNVNLNTFISKYYREKEAEQKYTGGFMKIVKKKSHPFKIYCNWLEAYRNEIFYSINREITFDELKEALYPLIVFYVTNHLLGKPSEELLNELLNPLKNFFDEMDKKFRTNFFNSKIEDLIKKTPNLTLKFVSIRNRPHENLLIEIYKLRTPELPEYSKKDFICTLRTNELGEAKTRLLEGVYQIIVPQYKHEELVNIGSDIKLERKLSQLKTKLADIKIKLIGVLPKISLVGSLFIPFLVGLIVIYLLNHLIPYDISLSKIITLFGDEYSFTSFTLMYLFPAESIVSIISWIAWVISGIISGILTRRIFISFTSTYGLGWLLLYILVGNQLSDLIRLLHWFIIIHVIVALLTFEFGRWIVQRIREA